MHVPSILLCSIYVIVCEGLIFAAAAAVDGFIALLDCILGLVLPGTVVLILVIVFMAYYIMTRQVLYAHLTDCRQGSAPNLLLALL